MHLTALHQGEKADKEAWREHRPLSKYCTQTSYSSTPFPQDRGTEEEHQGLEGQHRRRGIPQDALESPKI